MAERKKKREEKKEKTIKTINGMGFTLERKREGLWVGADWDGRRGEAR